LTTSIEESIPPCITTLEVTEKEGGAMRLSAECLFPRRFIGFKGHFPDNPVLPAIVQLATVRAIAEQGLHRPLALQKYSRTKFRAMIRPDQNVFFQLDIERSQGGYQGKFDIRDSDREPIAQGLFAFCIQR
jgi:3-hydroxyacyl-[acyl-carrier-protein] dehydratase